MRTLEYLLITALASAAAILIGTMVTSAIQFSMVNSAELIRSAGR